MVSSPLTVCCNAKQKNKTALYGLNILSYIQINCRIHVKQTKNGKVLMDNDSIVFVYKYIMIFNFIIWSHIVQPNQLLVQILLADSVEKRHLVDRLDTTTKQNGQLLGWSNNVQTRMINVRIFSYSFLHLQNCVVLNYNPSIESA